jgi:molybdate transport system substrate-binding protein
MRVAAAADLQTVLPELADAFTRASGASRPELVFGASGQLARQVAQGAPIDLFLSADRRFVEELVDQKILLADTARDYAQGTLCLVVHRSAGEVVRELGNLNEAQVRRVAIANPETAPYGRAAKQVLMAAGLWDSLKPKLVYAENVRQAYQYVQSGNAEAGLVGRSLADPAEVIRVDVDPRLHDPIIQRLGVVRDSSRVDAARAFADFLLGPEAQQIFLDHGFQPCSDLTGTNLGLGRP